MIREQIWASYVQSKFSAAYVHVLLRHYQRSERRLNIFLAVASSGSIAAWAVWQHFPLLWGTIIAGSQVVTVIKPYLPYFKYVKELNGKGQALELISIRYEHLWYQLEHKKIADEAVATNYFDLRKECVPLLTFSDETVLAKGNKFESEASQSVKTWLRTRYNIEIKID